MLTFIWIPKLNTLQLRGEPIEWSKKSLWFLWNFGTWYWLVSWRCVPRFGKNIQKVPLLCAKYVWKLLLKTPWDSMGIHHKWGVLTLRGKLRVFWALWSISWLHEYDAPQAPWFVTGTVLKSKVGTHSMDMVSITITIHDI